MRRTECSPTGADIAYKGDISLAEIMDGSQSSHMEMGGTM